MAKSCPQNELHSTIFINLQPPPADCKSLSASGEPDVLCPVYSDHHSEPQESKEGTYFWVHCQGRCTGIQKPGNSTLGKESRSFPARFTSHRGRLFLIVLWRAFPSCLRPCPPTQGRLCWTPGAVMVSSLLPTGTGALRRASLSHSFQWQCTADFGCGGDSWDLFLCKLLTVISLLFSKYAREFV